MPRRTDTIYVLEIDGGGSKGLVPVKFLQRFCQDAGINDAELWKYFDVITGTSVGSILAAGAAYGISLATLETLFVANVPWIFTIRNAADLLTGSINASTPSNRPNGTQRLAIAAQNDQFYRAVDPASNYGDARLKTSIREVFGNAVMNDLKTKCIVPAFKTDNTTYTLFSNYSNTRYPQFTGQTTLISDVVLASSAAPIYLPGYIFGGNTYVDGGIFQNNMSFFGEVLGTLTKSTATRSVIISVGCGIGNENYDDTDTVPVPDPSGTPFAEFLNSVMSIIKNGITGPQESIAQALKIRSVNNAINQRYHYRFQIQYPSDFDTDLDNSSPAYQQSLVNFVDSTYDAQTTEVNTITGHLLT
jgi:patatin-like phospholipase/acyl hydrolase